MAIEWTASTPNSETFNIMYQNRSFRADSGVTTMVEYGNPYWTCELTFQSLSKTKERALTTMLGQLRGMYGTIKVPSWTRKRIDDVGAITIATASNNAYTMIVNGTADTLILNAGDYISFSDEMFEVIYDVITDETGLGTVTLNKRLRTTYANGTEIEYQNPYCIMQLDSEEIIISRYNILADITISFTEAFRA